ncbi:integration host factor, actinobacterial type [Actinokineospora enzanensis]|uniref:integration host factor, actinobacterial type n=1 Tax=Actinokineospora enzanensis TaxID=155975 RepID=UPI00035FBD62|nr:integration host factor, actinobacterial type [Actinokineospora enzanensis]
MALPNLTPEQRAEALEKAAAARRQRSELLGKIKDGSMTVEAVLKTADNPIVTKTRIQSVLLAVPGYGKAKVTELMGRLEIDEKRRVGGLGPRQREALIATFA